MAELLMLKCNVAVPEIDEGRDVFAFVEGRVEVAHLHRVLGLSAHQVRRLVFLCQGHRVPSSSASLGASSVVPQSVDS